MFDFTNDTHSEALDNRIAELLKQLDNQSGSSDEYAKINKNLAVLMELRDKVIRTGNETSKIENEKVKLDNDLLRSGQQIDIEQDKLRLEEEKFVAEKENRLSWRPSPDAIVGAAASVVGILFVLHYEKFNAVTSKALGFVGKLK